LHESDDGWVVGATGNGDECDSLYNWFSRQLLRKSSSLAQDVLNHVLYHALFWHPLCAVLYLNSLSLSLSLFFGLAVTFDGKFVQKLRQSEKKKDQKLKKIELSAWLAACSYGKRQCLANALCRRAPNFYEGYVFEWNAQ